MGDTDYLAAERESAEKALSRFLATKSPPQAISYLLAMRRYVDAHPPVPVAALPAVKLAGPSPSNTLFSLVGPIVTRVTIDPRKLAFLGRPSQQSLPSAKPVPAPKRPSLSNSSGLDDGKRKLIVSIPKLPSPDLFEDTRHQTGFRESLMSVLQCSDVQTEPDKKAFNSWPARSIDLVVVAHDRLSTYEPYQKCQKLLNILVGGSTGELYKLKKEIVALHKSQSDAALRAATPTWKMAQIDLTEWLKTRTLPIRRAAAKKARRRFPTLSKK